MATLKDISRKLGISVTQVSRALNGHADVSAETRGRIEEAAKLLNYRPNVTARKLVSGRSGMVGLIYSSHAGIASDHNFLETVTGLSLQFSTREMQFVLHVTPEESDEIEAYERLVDAGSLDGFLVVEPYTDDPRVKYLKKRGIPFVVHGRTLAATDYPYFDIDNYGVARKLTNHLIEHGHERIALINGEVGRTYSVSRAKGYKEALMQAGHQFYPGLVYHGRMTEAFGLISTVQLFKNAKVRPTAIMAGNILIANGVYKALAALDLAIPRDVSVVAHDDVLQRLRASAFYPPLTVTRSPLSDSWSPLADFLSGAVRQEPLESLQQIAELHFVERGSVAECRDGPVWNL